ncbi:hypothetical protein [Streptomyces sp. NBC_00328]|uniref:hypothetical protein n=1 Tax=Streptomyces sp. NBC_00328 TaxID=2903646 RepID=UPI002E2D9B8A|nr:hypothetical protein [Streptomyces sp. NBC_00328]
MGLLVELQKRIPDGWLLRRLLPATLFVVVAVVGGGQLGWARWSDLNLACQRIASGLRPDQGLTSSSVAVLVLLASAAAAAAFAVPFAASAVAALTCGAWPWWLSPLAQQLTHRHHHRWSQRERIAVEAVRARANGHETRAARLDARRARISPDQPTSPTWSSNRLRTAEQRIKQTAGTNIAESWTTLVLTAPDPAREALIATRDAFDRACEAVVWGLAFTIVGLWWWPSALAGVLVCFASWRALRRSVETLCRITEAVAAL